MAFGPGIPYCIVDSPGQLETLLPLVRTGEGRQRPKSRIEAMFCESKTLMSRRCIREERLLPTYLFHCGSPASSLKCDPRFPESEADATARGIFTLFTPSISNFKQSKFQTPVTLAKNKKKPDPHYYISPKISPRGALRGSPKLSNDISPPLPEGQRSDHFSPASPPAQQTRASSFARRNPRSALLSNQGRRDLES